MAQLQIGKFYGAIQNQYRCDGLLLSEISHDRARKLPEHQHEAAYFSVLLGGLYREEGQGRLIEASRFSTIYHPPKTTHVDEVGGTGCRFFTIEVEKDWLEHCAPEGKQEIAVIEGPPLALRLYFAYRNRTITPLEVETMVLELLGNSTGRKPRRESATPRWLRRAVELIQDDPAFPHTVRSLAGMAGVHPVHLARVFRERYGYSIHYHVQSLRLRMVLRALENPEMRIADIACDAGFTDQSHLSRIVKRWTTLPPAALRRFLQT